MTYPKARYSRETGEVSARLRPANSSPDLVRSTGTEVHSLATGVMTEGLFGLYRWSMGPSRGGADPHFHRTMSESFYMLTGRVKIFDGKEVDAQIGDFVHVPPGGIHAFGNESGEPASMLIHFAPGAPLEAYFEALNDLVALTEDEKSAFLVAHDNLYV